jgi:hypothetical protein
VKQQVSRVPSFVHQKNSWEVMKMKADPIVAEVRKNREQLAERCGFDVKRLIAEAKSRQASSGHHLVSFSLDKPKAS